MTKTRDLSDFLIEGGTDLPTGIPHIVPGVLQPAVAGNDLSGTALGNSYVYGTAHTDGHKYYYTDIKGSKPIKDPRIGGHFGSQRHKFKSLQLLEQETATHGKNVYSLDGREWIRAVSGTSDWIMANDNWGNYPKNDSDCAGAIIEIVGYFNDINFLNSTYSDRVNDVDLYVNGTILVDGSTTVGGATTTNSPLGGRYVDASSAINGGSLTANGAGQSGTLASNLGTTPKINTLKFEVKTGSSKYVRLYGIELIAQDTSNRNNIQIPSQNVVSYGKKFTVSAEGSSGHHYDPFNAFTSGNLASVQALGIDTDTSLGLSKWLPSDAVTTYYRPFNGGRVVKWVDSSGVIKTSVNMMPPNAKSIANSASPTNAFATRTTASHFGTNNAMNSFEAGTDLDVDGLSEVAKTFHYREFGNGNANGGASGAYKDASMISSTSDVAFVMDDGLSSFSGDDVNVSGYDYAVGSATGTPSGDYFYITFIGTGLTLSLPSSNATEIGTQYTIAQNLPYGTHVYKQERSGSNAIHTLDGVVVATAAPNGAKYITIHQPKKPPIPEDACVIADYMLMADFVPQTSAGAGLISKGVRANSISRDVLFNETDDHGFALAQQVSNSYGWQVTLSGSADSDTSATSKLVGFGTNYVHRAFQSDTRVKLYLGGVDKDSSATKDNSSSHGSYAHLTTNLDLGVYSFEANSVSGQAINQSGFEIATPIHTSSHYQSFETPFLHELVGGDRNMEQTNLVCSPDGKTWDEVTRDASYMGPSTQLVVASDGGNWNGSAGLTDHRGFFSRFGLGHKNIAWGYDRAIILEEGLYDITLICTSTGGQIDVRIQRNNTGAGQNAAGTVYALIAEDHSNQVQAEFHCNRGDYIFIDEANGSGSVYGGNQETGAKLIITKMS